MKNLLLIAVAFFLPFYGFSQSDCNTLPNHYSSYSVAINQIRSAKFSLSEQANTSSSSFINSAEFFSCDGEKGFLIIGIGNRKYIHQNVPISVWNQFKNASSLGQFYDRNIKGRYLFYL